MTFLHKLAKRLAGFPTLGVTLFALSSCGDGQVQDYLGPNPNPSKNFISLTISPRDPQVALGDSVRFAATGWLADGKSEPLQVSWSASSGSITATGWFRPDGVGSFEVRAVATSKPSLVDSVRVASFSLVGGIARLEILPGVTGVPRGASQQFVAHAVLNDGSVVAPTVAWSAEGGTITSTGLFTATGPVGSASVSATLGAGLASAQAAVTIQPPMLTQLVLDPATVTMEAGETRQLTIGASWSDGSTAIPPLVWSVQGGSLSSQNLFTAGAMPGTFRIIATSPSFARADTAAVWVLPRLVGVRLLPATATLAPGANQPIQAFAIRDDGTQSPAGVEWSATGGSIAINGTYSAGSAAGQYRVVAQLTGLDGRVFSDTALMTIAAGSGTLTGVAVTPRSAVLPAGDPLQFTASGTWSDGSSAVPAVSWTATGGTIDAAGLYTAPTAAGSYKVIGKGKNGNGADTATVTVSPKLRTFRISPKVDTIVAGQTLGYSVTLTWSDGQTHPVTIAWSSTGGAISSDGVFSPGMFVGSALVVAVCSCGAADTAAVTVHSSSTASPVLTTLTLSPGSIVLAPGGVQQFSATGSWSDGSSGAVGVIYDATGGNISSAGFYLAGNETGTYRVIAVQQGGTKADTSVVTIASSATLNQLVLNPGSLTLGPGASQQFTASGIWSDGSTTAPVVVYSATGGSISSTGLFTAGQTTGTFAVIATQQGGTLSDTSLVTVSSSGPTLTQLVMNPSSVSVFPGSTQLFSVSASWSDGSSTLPPLSFSATGGTVSEGGLYTAGAVPGSYQVIVKHQGGTKADTSAVTIPALTSLTISPKPVSLAAGSAQLFSVAGTWSNGATTPPAVTYSATGGTISQAGLYTAGGTGGTFQVIALNTYGTRADTSVVTITGSISPPPPPPPSSGGVTPELPRVWLNTTYAPPTGQVISVAAGGNLQGALNSAACGDEIQLAPGATYTGNFILPARQCGSNPIHLRTAGTLPPEGVRVTPATAAGFAKLVTPNTDAALRAAAGARGYRILALELTVAPSVTLTYSLLRIGEGNEQTLAQLPGDAVIDRAYVHANATLSIMRCIVLNGVSTAVIDSYVADCHIKGFDSQAILGWNGPGPYKIVNNYLEGAGENILFGGAPAGPFGSPADIEIRRNHFYKPLAWLTSNAWSVKNLFELKNAIRVLVEGNLFENNWISAQTGSAMVFQSLNDGAGATWPYVATVQDITIRLNRITRSAGALSIAASNQYPGDGPVLPIARMLFENNLYEEMGRPELGGLGRMITLQGNIQGIAFNHDTFLFSTVSGTVKSWAMFLDDVPPISVLNVTNSLLDSGGIGLAGTTVGIGQIALDTYATSWQFAGNAITNQTQYSSKYPTGNFFPSSISSLGLDADARLGASSGLQGKALDGKDPGADITLLLQAIAGVP